MSLGDRSRPEITKPDFICVAIWILNDYLDCMGILVTRKRRLNHLILSGLRITKTSLLLVRFIQRCHPNLLNRMTLTINIQPNRTRDWQTIGHWSVGNQVVCSPIVSTCFGIKWFFLSSIVKNRVFESLSVAVNRRTMWADHTSIAVKKTIMESLVMESNVNGSHSSWFNYPIIESHLFRPYLSFNRFLLDLNFMIDHSISAHQNREWHHFSRFAI